MALRLGQSPLPCSGGGNTGKSLGSASSVIPGAPGTVGFAPLWVNPANNTSSNIAQQAIQSNLTVPVTYQWNLNTQYEFLPSWVLELGYVGSHESIRCRNRRRGFKGKLRRLTSDGGTGGCRRTVRKLRNLQCDYQQSSKRSSSRAEFGSFTHGALDPNDRKLQVQQPAGNS